MNDVKTKMEVQAQEIEHLRGIIDANRLEKEEIENARLKIKAKYKKMKADYEAREGHIEVFEADA